MTNEEYIKLKRKEKFDWAWRKKVDKLPGLTARSLWDSKGIYAFNKGTDERGEVFISCKKKNTKQTKRYYKKDFQEIFLDYEGYRKELDRILWAIDREREYFHPPFTNYRELETERKRYLLQKEYAEAFFRYLDCDISMENKYAQWTLSEIKDFIRLEKEKDRLSLRYFEFKRWKAKSLRPFLDVEVQEIIPKFEHERFFGYCNDYKIQSLYDLLLMPYYADSLVKYLGFETIETVIEETKKYIKFQVLFDRDIKDADILEYENEF